MDEIDREALRLCRETSTKLEEIQAHFEKRRAELDKKLEKLII